MCTELLEIFLVLLEMLFVFPELGAVFGAAAVRFLRWSGARCVRRPRREVRRALAILLPRSRHFGLGCGGELARLQGLLKLQSGCRCHQRRE